MKILNLTIKIVHQGIKKLHRHGCPFKIFDYKRNTVLIFKNSG
jgi:hypothetical protein